MALFSMTGFGNGSAEKSGVCVTVELVSVNRKQFDFAFFSPIPSPALETRCRELTSAGITRGRIQCYVKVTSAGEFGTFEYDVEEIKETAALMNKLADAVDLENDFTLSKILTLNNLSKNPAERLKSEEFELLVEDAFKEALDSLKLMRTNEGRALQEDLEKRISELRDLTEKISAIAPQVPIKQRELLKKRISELSITLEIDDSSLAKEIAFFADKCDISEELTRMKTHFDHFEELCTGKVSNGRKLDFLCQEMLREANTIGSKANDIYITKSVINLKSIIESIREQVQNIE